MDTTLDGPANRSSLVRHDPRETQLSFEGDGTINRALTAAARLLHQRGVLWRANFTVTGRLAGRPLRVPLQFGAGWEHLRMAEMWLFHGLERVMRARSGALVDVGVNVGHTLIKVKTIDSDREYVGFEPNPYCLRYTEQLVSVNRFTRCTIVPVAISNRTGIVKLFMTPDADPSATIVDGFRSRDYYARAVPVPVFVGDDALDTLGIDAVAAIKIDVEGAELDVLQGLERTVRQNQPYIFCEVLPVWDERTDIGRFRLERQTTLCTMIHDLGYEIFRIYFDASVESLDDFGVHGDLTMSNYVFVPREQLPAFRCLFAVGQATESTRIAGPADART